MFDKTFILNNYEQTTSNTLALNPTARVIYHSRLTTSHHSNKNNIMTDDNYQEYQTKSARQTCCIFRWNVIILSNSFRPLLKYVGIPNVVIPSSMLVSSPLFQFLNLLNIS